MKSLIKLAIFTLMFGSIVSCKKDTRPNYQFFPQMYEPVGYETYAESTMFPNDAVALLPAEGSIPRGFKPFDYENTVDGFELAKVNLKSPLDSTQIDLVRAKGLYDIYCGICHGNLGDGQGNLVKREKILGVPRYDDVGRAITEGSIYHTTYYGKNAMGSYANMLAEEERWQVVAYVLKLKADLQK